VFCFVAGVLLRANIKVVVGKKKKKKKKKTIVRFEDDRVVREL
jgi:hypothetical protein|tara:strand:+ start:578 stop:706 length:129 start_codon:yes stop_codon:yes gene_type:complete